MPFVDLDGVRLHFEETGSGRPIVFLHGWGMSGRVWHFQRDFAEKNRLIFPDFRGHGQSATADEYTLEAYSADLEKLLQRLDVHDAIVVGWSMGTQVALQSYSRVRSRVAALVLVGVTPRFTIAPDYEHGKPQAEVKGLGLRLRRDYQRAMGDFFKGMFVPDEMPPEQYQRIVHQIIMGGHSPDREAVLKSLQILDTADLRELLPEIGCPVLLVHGDSDTICPASAAQYAAHRLPHGDLRLMHGCGHAPFMTRPEEFNEILAEFLEGLGR
ncbi:alpha/beta hydrolase [Geomonas sp. RF6]|uniref:alpha/beta fold hydrolase n=1 Tax=Geomonas sp. RF6 TaxID=2897342 RepID=UPI001E450632|nr:alpha/beta hydrolase [Geomonas sp. RF6]UFS68622.1 alpha/beta hydrolase [Geomonas sp. RF6]